MNVFKSILVAAVLFVSNLGYASEPFSVMTCREIWPLNRESVRVRTSSTTLNIEIKGYSYSLPLSRCAFGKQLGHFTCNGGGAYAVRSISNRFSKQGKNVVQFTVNTEDGKTITSKLFTVEGSNIDGFGHPSECLVDNEHVYVRR